MRTSNVYFGLCLLLKVTLYYIAEAAAKSGPYKSTMVRVGPCMKPSLPLDKNPHILYYSEIYNTTTKTNLIRGNVTVVRDNKNKRIKSKGYYWEDGKWKVHYLMNNIGCHSVFMPVITAATGIKYDKRSCKFFKGMYLFENFDTNKIQHMWMTTQEYGRIMWRNEFYSQVGTVFCYEYEMLVEPEHK